MQNKKSMIAEPYILMDLHTLPVNDRGLLSTMICIGNTIFPVSGTGLGSVILASFLIFFEK